MSMQLQSFLLEKSQISNIFSPQKKIKSFLNRKQGSLTRKRKLKKITTITITIMEEDFWSRSFKILMVLSKEKGIQ